MKIKNQIIRNTLIYFMLILGYLYLYVVDIDVLLHPNKEIKSESKINFIYQQF